MSIPITLDFLSLHDFTNRLPILRFIIVCIGLEKVLCNNLPNSSQPTYHLTSPSYTMSVLPYLLSKVQFDSQSFPAPFFPPSLPSVVRTHLQGSNRLYTILSDSIRSVRSSMFPTLSKASSSLAKKDRIWVRVRFNNTSF